ncbi:hypothetical protein ACFFRR_009765 [Megaselia abdita]
MASKSLLLIVLVSYINYKNVLGECGKCQLNHVACVTETKFVPCKGSELSDKLVSCPSGTYCSDHENICVSSCKGVASCLNVCNKCEQTVDTKFACRNETSYSICLENVMEVEVLNCDEGYICDISSPNICSNKTLVKPQCFGNNSEDLPISDFTTTPVVTTALVGTTTDKIVIDQETVDDYCQNSPDKIYISFDPNCKSYIICTVDGDGKRTGLATSCVNYFNKDTSLCQEEKPANCQ